MPITIKVPDYNTLFEHIKRPHLRSEIVDHDLGEDSSPIEWIVLNTQSDGRSYALDAGLIFHGDVGDVVEQASKALDGKYLFGIRFSDGFLVRSPRFSKLSESNTLFQAIFGWDDSIEVSRSGGALYVSAGAGLSKATDPRPIQGISRFREEFEFFRDVTQIAINAVYRNFGAGQVPTYVIKVAVEAPAHTLSPEEKEITERATARAIARRTANQPSGLEQLIVEKLDIDFDQIIGNVEAKEELLGLAQGMKDPAAYAKWGTELPKGVLLYGPPGTAKTTLARAAAYHAKVAFYAPKLPELLSKWYGESEQKVQELFDKAKRTAPSIVFLDEIDILGRRRDAAYEASERVLSVILTNIEGITPTTGVVVIGATNRPYVLDEALTRPGRLDRLIEVYLPTPGELAQIFVVHQKLAEERASRQLFEPSVDYLQIAAKLQDASGADAREIIRRVLQEQARAERRGEKVGLVGIEHVLKVVAAYERKPAAGEYQEKRRLGFRTPNGGKQQ